jgi:hypothetical protein
MKCTGMRCSALKLAFWTLIVVTCWSCAATQPSPDKAEGTTAGIRETAARTTTGGDERALSSPFIVPYYPPPSAMDLCGEPVPLQNREVLERFDREFTLVVYNHAQIYLWLKRMERYFPWIEQQLRASGLPDDLKYVAVVESDLLPEAFSPKGAAGPWQFMPSTGSAYGLRQQGSLDERYDFERATECAFRFLQDLYRRYKNWTVAIATYNCGDKRVQEQMRALGTADYYQMQLPTETERYIFRILAVKAILGNPGRYGYHLPTGEGYPPLKAKRVNVQLSCPLPLQAVAEASGTTVREIKRLNPAFRADEIPQGSHQVKLPDGPTGDLEKRIEQTNRRAPAEETPTHSRQANEGWREPSRSPGGSASTRQGSAERGQGARKEEQASKAETERVQPKGISRTAAHTVKKGETLSSIAARHNVSVDALKRANNLKSVNVSTGQKLVIP